MAYVKEGSEYDCALKVQWSWAGKAASVIAGKSLIHSAAREAELKAIVAAAGGDDDNNDGDGGGDDKEDRELSLSDLPAAVQKTIKANLNGAVIDEIDTGTDDGKSVYEVEAKLEPIVKLDLWFNGPGKEIKHVVAGGRGVHRKLEKRLIVQHGDAKNDGKSVVDGKPEVVGKL